MSNKNRIHPSSELYYVPIRSGIFFYVVIIISSCYYVVNNKFIEGEKKKIRNISAALSQQSKTR